MAIIFFFPSLNFTSSLSLLHTNVFLEMDDVRSDIARGESLKTAPKIFEMCRIRAKVELNSMARVEKRRVSEKA